ncbi:MAG TPA: energy-coupling factor transporter ATPase [Firmicutes bacterium]|nr:energy-coupling factor transporter ATPase [Bacillota bacterium]HHY98446.1 energy-coupling factor transporter ATPase [Bacillota bacterium]
MAIKVEHLTHVYMAGTPFEVRALEDVNLLIEDGEFIGLIGKTGSGKSTLIQHLNGLLRPTSGTVYVDGVDIFARGVKLTTTRQKVGLLFQYPEHQLFEETVYQDVAFGPRNLKLPEEEVSRRVKEALEMVGLDFESVKDRSPFELSGGQMRRVAMAGVLAMNPRVLILDEPAAGLDPRGRDEILGKIEELHRKHSLTVILVSHSMEDVARLVKRLVVMHDGHIVMDGPTREVFLKAAELQQIGLGVPEVTRLMGELRKRGKDVRPVVLTVDEARREIASLLRREGRA